MRETREQKDMAGPKEIRLTVHENNKGGGNFIKNHGFVETGVWFGKVGKTEVA